MPWVQKYQWMPDPPRLTNVPEGYETAVVKSGTHWPYYAYERFVDAPDWV